MESFVYCWTDRATNKLYIGKHKGSTDDRYISSSKYMLEEYIRRREDFCREILAVGNDEDMVAFESAILIALNAAKDPLFYNMHNNNGRGNAAVKWHTAETKKKMSVSRLKVLEEKPEIRQRISESASRRKAELNPFFGRTHTEEARSKMGLTKKTLFAGSGNPNSRPVKYNGKTYSTMKDMSAMEGISMYHIRGMIARNEVEMVK